MKAYDEEPYTKGRKKYERTTTPSFPQVKFYSKTSLSRQRLEAELAEEPLVLPRGVALLEHLLDLLARLTQCSTVSALPSKRCLLVKPLDRRLLRKGCLRALGRVLHQLRCDAQRLEVHLDGITAHPPRTRQSLGHALTRPSNNKASSQPSSSPRDGVSIVYVCVYVVCVHSQQTLCLSLTQMPNVSMLFDWHRAQVPSEDAYERDRDTHTEREIGATARMRHRPQRRANGPLTAQRGGIHCQEREKIPQFSLPLSLSPIEEWTRTGWASSG